MITRSKARAMKARGETRAAKEIPTTIPVQHPSSHVPHGFPQARQSAQVLNSRNDQSQYQPGDVEAALLAAFNQMAADQDQDVLAGAGAGQHPIDEAVFDPAALEHLATIAARLDLLRTSCKIAGQFFQVAVMACQASVGVQQKISSFSSYVVEEQLGIWLGIWPGVIAVTFFFVLLHLFNVMFVRRFGTRESLAERVTASAAMFLAVGAALKNRLEWMLVLRI